MRKMAKPWQTRAMPAMCMVSTAMRMICDSRLLNLYGFLSSRPCCCWVCSLPDSSNSCLQTHWTHKEACCVLLARDIPRSPSCLWGATVPGGFGPISKFSFAYLYRADAACIHIFFADAAAGRGPLPCTAMLPCSKHKQARPAVPPTVCPCHDLGSSQGSSWAVRHHQTGLRS